MIASHELLGFMPAPLALEIVEFTFSDDKPTYRAVLKAVADSRKVRAIFLERQPRAERHQTMLASLSRPGLELMAGNLIRVWLLKKHAALLGDFLDALGVPHKEGVAEDLPQEMGEEKVKAAVEAVLVKHSKEVVTVYLHAFNTMNETRWPALQELLKADARLQL
jgi:hypothetical protein